MKVNTTALVVELLLGGALLEVAGFLALDGLTPGSLFGVLDAAGATGTVVVTSMSLVVAYYLGSMLNLAAQVVFKPLERFQRGRVLALSAEDARLGRVTVFAASAELREYLDAIYAQVRIFRGAALGFAVLGVSTALWQAPASPPWPRAWLPVACFGIAAAAVTSLGFSLRSYFKVLKAALRYLDLARADGRPGASGPNAG